jgi:osmotically-inducible protein OsmY
MSMAEGYPYNRDRHDREDRDRHERDRYGRDDRGPLDRAGDEVRSWFGNDEAARRRQMDEQERERWQRGSRWGAERSYGSDREYGDRPYGWRGESREYGGEVADRDYGAWRTPPAASGYTGMSYAPYDRPTPDSTGYTEYGRQSYGGPYGRERYGAREWSSTEGWRVPGPHTGRGPRGYQRSDERIREEVNDRLTAHGLIDATDVECRVQSGEVTLTGFVDSRAAKRAAEDIAEDVAGVREVHNQLRIRTHAGEEGVGRTNVLGITEAQTQTPQRQPASPADQGRPRTRS